MTIKVWISIPCYGGHLSYFTATSVIGTVRDAERHNPKIPIDWQFSSGILPSIRNSAIGDFLKSDATHLFFIDADIAFSPLDFFKLLFRNWPIGVANYWRKQVERRSTVIKDGLWIDPRKYVEPVEIDFAGFGFACIQRHVIEHLAQESYRFEEKGVTVPVICEAGMVGDFFCETEDSAFFLKAKKLGYKVMLDPTIKLGHVGTFVYG